MIKFIIVLVIFYSTNLLACGEVKQLQNLVIFEKNTENNKYLIKILYPKRLAKQEVYDVRFYLDSKTSFLNLPAKSYDAKGVMELEASDKYWVTYITIDKVSYHNSGIVFNYMNDKDISTSCGTFVSYTLSELEQINKSKRAQSRFK